MLVMRRTTGGCELRNFSGILDYLRAGDCLVMNDTRVIPARLFGRRLESGGRVEALLCEDLGGGLWRALLKPGRRLRPGVRIAFGKAVVATAAVEGRNDDNSFDLRFDRADLLEWLSEHGELPLPPYIRRLPRPSDLERYQTIYASQPGAVAAPTAGLHFDREILRRIEGRGVEIAYLTLHVGPGTFQPVKSERIEEHRMHEERYALGEESAGRINQCRARGGRAIAVGTTCVRVLETCADREGRVRAAAGRTRLFMHPPMRPRAVDGLLTNFHLPRSTLMMLVATFCSTEHLLAAYELAIRERMRFYSYGDCMLLL